jgi:DNA-binding transcriptional ArsR family regulator
MPPTNRSAAPTAPTRAPVRSVGSGATLPMTFDVRTAFDFALSLSAEVGGQDELPEADRRWLLEARATLPATADQGLDDELCIFGAGLLVDRPDVTDAAGYVQLLRETSGEAFANIVLADNLRDPELDTDVVAALAGDGAAAQRVAPCWPEHKRGWLSGLFENPLSMIGLVADRMEAWLPRYQEIEARVQTILERDVALRAGDRATLAAPELVERTTNGVRFLSEPGVRRLVLAPSYLVRPYNFTFTGADWRIFVYPVADAALEPHDPLAPPVGVLRLHRALGDDTRLRILRLLRDRDWYLTEIAERLELSKPTIKHHLALLRAAGLVTLTEEGGLSYYSLRRERLDDASSELKRYLV